jgi:hypothetical protein
VDNTVVIVVLQMVPAALHWVCQNRSVAQMLAATVLLVAYAVTLSPMVSAQQWANQM